jgi:hypothetical protein
MFYTLSEKAPPMPNDDNASRGLDTAHTTATKSLRFNVDECRREHDLGEEYSDEYIESLWNIMRTFAEIGWGVSPEQVACPELYKLIKDSFFTDEEQGDGI